MKFEYHTSIKSELYIVLHINKYLNKINKQIIYKYYLSDYHEFIIAN